jgi:hypothetical protein
MKLCLSLSLAFACCAVSLWAQIQMNVQQLTEMVHSSVSLHHDDRIVADYLKKVKLSEKLTDQTIQDLMAEGAGPKTVDALKRLRDESANIKTPSNDEPASSAKSPEPAAVEPKETLPPPSSQKQEEMLDQIKQYASTYTQNLPNFICTQVTRRYVDPTGSVNGGDHYRITDTINAQLSYANGQEKYRTVMVNNKVIAGDAADESVWNTGTRSNGEFGIMMAAIFDPHTETKFHWSYWRNLDGKSMTVYSYFVDSGHSNYSIEYNDQQHIITAYKGLIYADPFTGVINRLTIDAVGIPSSFPVQEAREVLDYGPQTIGESQYICPLKAQLYLHSGAEKTRNDIEFRLYKKFGSDIKITYDTPAALPDRQEKPLKSLPANDDDVPLPPNSAPPPPPM